MVPSVLSHLSVQNVTKHERALIMKTAIDKTPHSRTAKHSILQNGHGYCHSPHGTPLNNGLALVYMDTEIPNILGSMLLAA